MSTGLRRGAAAFAAAALLVASCGDDGVGSRANDDDRPDETVPADDESAPVEPGEDVEEVAPTTEPAPPRFAGLDHSSPAPAIAICDALETRDADAVVELMADDAIATDHGTGEIYRGRDEIRAWIGGDPSFDYFEKTGCGPSDDAIASHFWSALTYTFYSDTNPGGTEGIAVVGVIDGRIERLELVYGLSPDETDVEEPVSDADAATLTAWCEAWRAFDVDQMLALTTSDVLVVPNTMASEIFFRPAPGPGGILGAMEFVRGGNLDRLEVEGECADADRVANGGWIAYTSVLVDDESTKTLGGVTAMQLRDGLISAWIGGGDAMNDGTPVFEPAPEPPPEPTSPPVIVDTITALETDSWWEFAGDFLGIPLRGRTERAAVAADVVEVCDFLAADPASFDALLDELTRLGERRTATLGAGDAQAYAFVLDTAISSACPEGAAVADALRPPPDPSLRPTRELGALEVADPRPGDLRTDADADVLPADYEPPPAFWKLQFAYGSHPAQQLDLYLPPQANAPVVLFLHSGGWTSGDKSGVKDMVLRFVERGYAVASVGYRLAPAHTFPAQIHDAKRAIRSLKALGARGNVIDGERIVLFGTSAGGHIATFVAATPGLFEPPDLTPEESTFDSTVAGLVSVVGPTDLVSLYEPGTRGWVTTLPEALLGCSPCRDTQLAEASPISYLSPDLPPAYFAYGRTDEVLVHWNTQGAVIASAWAEQIGRDASWFDLIEGQGHNIDETSINQRALEEFVDLAVGQR